MTLAAALDAAPGALLLLDGDDQVVFCNTRFREIWGIADDRVLTDRNVLIAHMDDCLADKSESASELIGAGPSPQTFMLTSGTTLIGRYWHFDTAFGTRNQAWQFHEVVDRFVLNDARLQDFAELASDYIWETDSDGRFTFLSSQFRDVTGIPRAQVLGKTRDEIWSEHGQPDNDLNVRYLAESQEFVNRREAFADIRVEWHRPDGRDLVLSMTAKPVFDPNGTFRGYRGIAKDITETARTVEGLRDSEAHLRDLLDGAPVGVSIVSKDTARRLYVNQAFADMIGDGASTDLLGEDARDTWADAQERRQFVSILESGEDVRDFEHRRRRLDGTIIWTLMNSRAVEFAGEAAYMFWFVDITARRETERLVRESEQRLRQILDQSPIAVSVISEDNQSRHFANSAFIDMIGADNLDEALSLDPEATWHDPLRFAELRAVVEGGGDVDNFEGIRRRIDGTTFPCAVTSRSMPFAGKPSRVFWAIDLSEQRKADDIVRQSEERLRTIVESSPIGFAVISRDGGRRLFVNRTILDMFGAESLAEFEKYPLEDLWVDPKQREELHEIIRDGDLVNFEAERVRVDGSRFWALLNSRSIEFEGEPARIAWMTDISDRVASEASIRESEEKLREILETSPLGISVISRSSFERVFANNAMAQLFHAPSSDALVASPVIDSWSSYESKMAAEQYLRSDHGYINFEAHRRRNDGTEFWCLHNSSKIVFEGEPAWVVWHNDISDIKSQQQAFLQAKEEADAASRAKSEFLSSMSHELRTPLNAILGFAQLLQMTPDAPLSEGQNSSVEQIMRGGQHLLGLIDQVLDLAKIEGGQIDLDIGPVEVDAALLECRELVQATADRLGIALELDPTCHDPDLIVIADPTRLRQVVLNLLSNAIKYNRQDGSVRVSCRIDDADMLRIAVGDTGTGIPRDQWISVFEPFSRLGAEMTDIEGTGIGLTLSKELTEKMGGQIGFDSEVGIGSTFWITVPMAPVTEPDADERDDPSEQISLAAESEGVALYVEDNPANLQLVELIFEHLDGLRLISAPTGEAGVEMAESHLPDVIMMDIRLPGIDGFEALRRLRANPKTAHIPVIALSADAMPENVVQGRAAGFVDYLTKPLNVGKLVEVLNTALTAAGGDDDE